MDGSTSSCCLKDLPHDVVLEVFYQLSFASLVTMSTVCQAMYAISKTPSLWKNLCKTTFGLSFRDNRELCNNRLTSWKEVFKDLYTKSTSRSLAVLTDSMGCPHYKRNCQIRARCCSEFFPCRLCHDIACKDHHIDRFATDTMVCMKCLCVQYCTSCSAEMAPYYCGHCKLWSSLENGPIYHCDKCGICRQGKGLGIDNWHCDNCGICLSLSMKATHECQIKDGLKVTCPLCPSPQLLFYSREPVTVLPCGHASHVKCLHERFQQNLSADEEACPICEQRRQARNSEASRQEENQERRERTTSYQHSAPLLSSPTRKVATGHRATCSHHL